MCFRDKLRTAYKEAVQGSRPSALVVMDSFIVNERGFASSYLVIHLPDLSSTQVPPRGTRFKVSSADQCLTRNFDLILHDAFDIL